MRGAVAQVSNWVQLAGSSSYSALFAQSAALVSPVAHYWSLAIEEQFYLLWPVVAVALARRARRAGRPVLRPFALLTALCALVAPAIAVVAGPDAAYWATPARLGEMLVGATAAAWLVNGGRVPAGARYLAPPALGAVVALAVLLPAGSGPAYTGWMTPLALVSVALVLSLQVPGAVRSTLSLRPVVWLGTISYGVYLYHWPVFVLIDRETWDLPVGVVLLIKSSITLVVAVVSYSLVERPIRTASWMPPRRTLVAALAGTAVASIIAITVVPATTKYYGVDSAAAEQAAIDSGPVEPLVPLSPATTTVTSVTAGAGDAVPSTVLAAEPSTTLPPVTTTTQLAVPPRPVRILVVGDSTAEATGAGLVAWAAANPQYAQVSVAAGPGCGLVLIGYLELTTGQRDTDAECGPYARDFVPAKAVELQPDVVMVMTTVWDVLDRRLTKDGPLLPATDPAVEAAMVASLGEFTDRLLALGVPRVVWVDGPVPLGSLVGGDDSQAQPARHATLHRAVASVAATRPAVRVVDLAAWLHDQPIGADRSARLDGVHWTGKAALQISAEFLGAALVQAALS